MTTDGGLLEEREAQDAANTGARSRDHVDEDQLPVDLDADASAGFRIRTDSVGVHPESRPMQDDAADDDDDRRDDNDRGHLTKRVAEAHRVNEHLGDSRDVDAAGQHLREAKGHAQGSEGHDECRHLRTADEESVDESPCGTAGDRHERSDERGCPALGTEVLHDLRGDDAAEDEHGANRQIDARRDDDEGCADAKDREDRRVHDDRPEGEDREERIGRHDREEDEQSDQDEDNLGRLNTTQAS